MTELSDIVVVSSDEEGNSKQSETATGSVVSVEESESDCEIVSITDAQEEKWRDVRGPLKRLNVLLRAGHNDPKLLLVHLFGMEESSLPNDPLQLWGLLLTLLAEPAPRHRLRHVNTLDKVIELLTSSKSILVVTGAGISVSCGIPDFRSRDGVYARLSKDYPDLSSPQAMFDMAYFVQNPSPFFKFAKEIFPGQFTPSLTHRFVSLLEAKDKLLRNYTQNIDTLEQAAGITRLIQCHGSFASASCTSCKYRVPGVQIQEAIFAQRIPYCPHCRPNEVGTITCPPNDSSSPSTATSPIANKVSEVIPDSCTNHRVTSGASFGVMKPDIVFFGEDLSSEFHDALASDVKKTDLVLVMGSSLKVRPVSHIPNSIPSNVPQVLINREALSNHDFDVELLGDCDVIVSELCTRLGWILDENLGSVAAKPGTMIPLPQLWELRLKKESDPQTLVSNASHQTTTQNALLPKETSVDAQSMNISFNKTSSIDSEKMCEKNTTEVYRGDDTDADSDEEESLWDVASSLPLGSFTRIPPNQYVFPGAEVYINQDEDMSMIFSCHESSCSSESSGDEDSHGGGTDKGRECAVDCGKVIDSDVTKDWPMTVRTDEAGDHILRRLLSHSESRGTPSRRTNVSETLHRSSAFSTSTHEKRTHKDEPQTPPPTPCNADANYHPPLTLSMHEVDGAEKETSSVSEVKSTITSSTEGPEAKRPRSEDGSNGN